MSHNFSKEVFTLATNSLATGQVRKDTPSLIGAMKAFFARKNSLAKRMIFQQWSKKTEAILCWCDQGLRNDVGVVRQVGIRAAAELSWLSRVMRQTSHCPQLAEEPVGDMAKTAETL